MILLQKRDFGEGCDDGWEDCPKYVFNGTTGTQLGANFCCRVFFYPNFIMVMIIIIRVTVLTSWRPSQRPAISLTVFTMQTGIKGLSSKN